MKNKILLLLFWLSQSMASGQTLFVPDGFSSAGIGTSTVASKVGIGTNAPGFNLDVLDHLRVQGATPYLIIGRSNDNFSPSLYSYVTSFANDNFSFAINNNSQGSFPTPTYNSSRIRLFTTNNSTSPSILFETRPPDGSYGTRMSISNDGNVGIGTTSPRSPLEIWLPGDNNSVQTGLILQQTNPGVPNNTAGVSLEFGIGNNGVNNNIEGKITLKETYWSTKPKMFFSLWDQANAMKDRMVIDTDGRVGIGTTTPASPFHIKASGNLSHLSIETDQNGEGDLRWYQGGTSEANERAAFQLDISSGDFEGYVYGSSWLQWLRVNRMTSYVGIGTTTPMARLHVAGAGGGSIDFRVNGRIVVGDGGEAGGMWVNGAQTMFVGQSSATKLGFYNGGAWRMIVDNNGNVGIGTEAPGTFKLAVEGKIGAREVNVTTTAWNDYVFSKDYKLRPLSELRQFITEHHHLPDVPSEKEVLQNGQNLGEMNAVLLKKVEELTLYVIEQNTMLNGQNEMIMKMNDRILQLESSKQK